MVNNNYHDLVDRNEIAKAVAFRNGEGLALDNFRPHVFYGKTVDEAIEYWKSQAQKTEELDKVLKLYEENSDLLSSGEDFVMVRELLTHPERDRLRLIHDGSYYTHRIWFHINNDGLVEVLPRIGWMNSEFKRMSNQLNEKSPREKIDFLFKNFEVVYVQTHMFENRRSIESMIRWEQFEREYDYAGYDDIC